MWRFCVRSYLKYDRHPQTLCEAAPLPEPRSTLIYCTDISLSFGGQEVFRDLNWTVPSDKRIGLIGPNGAGKSTLLRILSGRIRPDSGTLAYEGNVTVGYLEQDVQEADTGQTVLDEALKAFQHVLDAEAEMDRISHELEAESDHTTERYERLLHALDRAQTTLQSNDSHMIRPKAEAVLTGLGFEAADLGRPLATYSGGWRMRATLARLLLRRPSVLLLDEPTNHLDIESIDWLENYLQSYEGTVVIVSHDRYFLDRMVNHISEIAHSRIYDYAGNYSFYLRERVARREIQRAAYENQQKEIADTERFIERFRYKATKATQVQSRIKHLEKIERVPPPPSESATIGFRFPEPPKSGRTVLELSRFSKTYPSPSGTIHVFDNTGPLSIERGDKIALIGKNGAGKSTLARILNDREEFEGARDEGYRVMRTFFAQHQAETLDPTRTVLESLQEASPGEGETRLRTLLGAFLFTGDDVFKPVSVLSGGERSRLALARTLLSPANFLILDEPTNHLDIQSIEVLVEALKQYTGTFVVVSHDRHFLDEVATKVWAVGGGAVREFPGTYSEYRWSLEQGTAASHQPAAPVAPADVRSRESNGPASGPKSREQKRREAKERQALYDALERGESIDLDALTGEQRQRLYERVESEVLELETLVESLQARMADSEVYQDARSFGRVAAELERAQDRLADRTRRWEELADLLAAG